MNNPSPKPPLEQHLTSAYISLQPPSSSPLLAESHLLSCLSLLSTSSSLHALSAPILNKLNRISHHSNISLQFLLGELYILLFNFPPNVLFPPSLSSTSLLISFINQSMHLHNILKQTSLNYKYLHSLQNFISTVLSTTTYTFTSSQQSTLQNIYNTNNNIQHPSSLSSFNTSITFESGFVKHLYDMLTSTSSLHEQYTLLTSNIDVIEKLIHSITFTNNEHNDNGNDNNTLYETFFDLGKLLLLFFPNKHNLTFLAKSTPSHADTNHTMHFIYDDSDISHAEFLHKQKYTLYIDDDIQHQRNLLIPLILTYTQQLSTYQQKEFPVHYLRYTLLKRIFLNDSNNNDNLLTQFTNTLCYFIQTFPNNNNNYEIKQFITLIMHSQSIYFINLKQRLHIALQNIDSSLYASSVVSTTDDDDELFYEDLCLLNYDYKNGMFERIEVQPGETYTLYVYLQRKRALLDLCFALDNKDINVCVTSISPEGKTNEVVNAAKLLSTDTPMKLLLYNNKRVVYKIQFDNSYSWFNSKTLQIKYNTFYPHSEHAVNQRINAIRLRHELMQTKTNDNVNNNNDNNKLIIVKDKIYSCYYVKDNVDKMNMMITNGSVKVYAVYVNKEKMMFYDNDYNTQHALNEQEFAKQVNALLCKDKNAFCVVNVCDISTNDEECDDIGDINKVLGFNVDETFNSDECLFFYYKCINYEVVYDVYQCLLSGIKYDKVVHVNCHCCGTGNQYEMAMYTNNHEVKVHYSDDISNIIAHITKVNNEHINYTNEIKVFVCCNNNNNNNTCKGYTDIHSNITNINNVNMNIDVIKINDTVAYWNELKVIAPLLLIDNV